MNTYKDSGVDVEGAEKLVGELKKKFSSIGGYAGTFDIGAGRIAATCDGVGTKIILLAALGLHETAGIDLVAMNVNDLIAGGAKPLFFMDYFSCGKLDKEVFRRVISGIDSALKKVDSILLGGETAEMPDMYKEGEYDLAGFSCGIPVKEFKREEIKKGDIIAGLASSGIHSNGFSLVRKVLSREEIEENKNIILKPTRIYSELIKGREFPDGIKSLAHVTGGGIDRALKRLLPASLNPLITLPPPGEVFRLIASKGVEKEEMRRVFNMGIGMLMVIQENKAEKVCTQTGAIKLGRIK